MEINEPELLLMKEHLGIVMDRRRRGGHFLRNLVDILVIRLSVALRGWTDFEQMESPRQEWEAFSKWFLELPHGIPDTYTFNRAFSSVQSAQLLEAIKSWYVESEKSEGRRYGRARRRGKKAVPMVSLWFGVEHMVIGQKACDEKSNEITAIPELLDQLEVEGDTITIDAMGCQAMITEKIREQKADYVLPVKENRPALYNDIKDYFDLVEERWERNPQSDVWSSGVGKKRQGRIESREVLMEENLDWMSGGEKWKDMKSIILYRRKCVIGDTTTVSTHYSVSSLALDAGEAARAVCVHWSIEDNLHWRLDVCFGEDAGRARRNHAAENLNILRKTALYLL
jgi:predicted transposase YbfD/YdcC